MNKKQKKMLYESIMKLVAKTVKKVINESKETTDFEEIQSGEKLPAPLAKLKNMVNHNNNLAFYGFRKRIYRGNPDYKINIGVDNADFEFFFTINFEVEDTNTWLVYVKHTVEGLETEVASGYLDIDEFTELVIDVIEEAANSPEDYEEYCYSPEDYEEDY